MKCIRSIRILSCTVFFLAIAAFAVVTAANVIAADQRTIQKPDPTSTPPGGKTTPPAVGTPKTQPPLLPDIVHGVKLEIGDKYVGDQAKWDGKVTVFANNADSMKDGKCQFVITYSIHNDGYAPTGSFESLWKNSHVPGIWGQTIKSIEPGKVVAVQDKVVLKPGTNVLSLTLDPNNKVKELNETNNYSRVTIEVSGTCKSSKP